MEWMSFSERLIDYVIIIGPGRGLLFDQSKRRKTSFGSLAYLDNWYRVSQPVPTILRRFPETDHKDFELAFDMAYFCQPNGCCDDIREPRTHVFMLTDTETNLHTYGVCLSLPHLFDSLASTQECDILDSDSICIQEWGVLSVCILSHHPFFHFFEKSLMTLFHFVEHFCGSTLNWNTLIQPHYQPTGLHGDEREDAKWKVVQEVEEWINGLVTLKAPIPCESALEVELEVDPATVVCYPPPNRLPLLELPVHKIFQKLGVCTVLEIFKLVLSEQKVVLHSEDPAFVTECVLTFVGLLYPLQYLFPIIPLLPTSMPTAENLLMVPTPFFIGVCSSFLPKIREIHHTESWIICLDTLQIQSPAQLDQPLLEFPFCILQLQADIRKALDKIEKINKPDVSATEASECSILSTEEQQVHCVAAEVDVMIRTAFVEFLFNPEILGCVDQCLCIFRLFPRPVVSLRPSTFMTTYQKNAPTTDTKFIRNLIRSQGIEYFFEWSLNPTNFTYEEIRKGIREVERVSDKQRHFLHKSGIHIDQVCLYKAEDSSILYQEMLTYKAGQASFHLISPHDLQSDDSDWEYLGGDLCDWSEFSASTPSYDSHENSRSPSYVEKLIIASQAESNPLDNRLPVVGNFGLGSGQEESDIEVEFVTPRRFTFPEIEPTATNTELMTAARHEEESPDASSLTESAHYASHPSSHHLHLTPFSPHGITRSVSCEALPVTARYGYRGVDKPDSPEKYITPRSLKGSPSKFPAFYRAPTPPIVSPMSPTERYYQEDTVLVTRRTISGNPEIRRSWLNLTAITAATPSTEVVEFSTPPSNLQRSNSVRVKGERGKTTPSVSRTVPLTAVTHSQALESQLHNLVNKILSGQGLPWPKPIGLKRLATHEKTRVMVLRLLEVKLGVRTPDVLVMSSGMYVVPKGVPKPVFKGLVELLKYLLQCIEEELQKEPEAAIFSAFLILRLAFSIHLQTKERQSSLSMAKLENERHSPFSFLAQFSSKASESTAQISSRRSRSPSSASSSSRSSPNSPPINFSTSTKTSQLARHTSASTNTSDAETVSVGHTAGLHGHNGGDVTIPKSVSGELDRNKGLANGDVGSTPLSHDELLDDGSTATLVANTGTPSQAVSERVGDEGGGNEGQPCDTATPLPNGDIDRISHSNLPTEPTRLTHVVQNGVISESAASNKAPHTSTPNTKSSHPAPQLQFPHRSGSPMPFFKNQKQGQSSPQSPTLFPPLPEGQDLKGCTFIYKDLMKALGSSRTFLLNRLFWNVLFMSTVDMNRSYLGWNERTTELYERYSSLSEAHRQAFGSEEDTLLSLVLHNLLVYMLMVGLSPEETTDLIHRLMARTRLATAEERLLQQTLKHVEQNTSTEVDLSDLGLLALYSEIHPTISYIVHYGVNMIAPVYKLQITDEALILRRFPDEKISSRLWNDCISEISCSERRATVSIKYRDTHGEYSHHFHSKQFMKVYKSLQVLVLPRSS